MNAVRRTQILVIEDNPDAAALVVCTLESAGYEVKVEGGGRSGLRYAIAHPVDLIVLDVRLPDVHGYQVCDDLRKHFGDIRVPIVMLTVMDEPIDKLRGLTVGADVYLTKPFEPRQLLDVVARLLKGEWIRQPSKTRTQRSDALERLF